MPAQKIARLCWNTNRWVRPSGPLGKNKNKDPKTGKKSFEYENGFGHEEWLFDTAKTIEGHHYGFIQAIGNHHATYIDQCFDIFLYAIDSKSRDRWWIGCIRNAAVIDEAEVQQIAKEYRRRGWLKEMKQQLADARQGHVYPSFDTSALAFSNVKFLPSDLEVLDPPIRFSYGDPAVRSNYYNLLNFVAEPKTVSNRKKTSFTPGHAPGKGSATRTYDEMSVEINLAESQLQTAVFEHLVRVNGKSNVTTEYRTEYGTAVDIVVRHVSKTNSERYAFYELKVLDSPRMCIRHAFAQLMEYCYFPNARRASKLIVVAKHYASPDIRQYMNELRNRFSIPIFYQRFDDDEQRLDEELV